MYGNDVSGPTTRNVEIVELHIRFALLLDLEVRFSRIYIQPVQPVWSQISLAGLDVKDFEQKQFFAGNSYRTCSH